MPAAGEPGDEISRDVPYDVRVYVPSSTAPSVDFDLNLVFVGTSVTSPAPQFLRDAMENTHPHHNSTLPSIQTRRDPLELPAPSHHWDLDDPFERLRVDTAVVPDSPAVS